MNKSKIIHLITPFLFHTGSWIYSQLTSIKKFSNFVFTYRRENTQQFPWDAVYSADEMSLLKQLLTKIYLKRNKENYGLFFRSYVKEISPDLFHAHMGYEAVRWLRFLKSTQLPLITTFYGQDVSKLGRIPFWRDRYQEVFEFGKYFLAEGAYLKSQLESLGCPEKKIIIQHLGVDLDKYPLKIHTINSGSEITLLQVSTFREKKGIEYSLRALKVVLSSYPKIKLNLIGKGDDNDASQRIFELVRKLNLTENVNLLGVKSHYETILEMLKADIFIHPSVTSADGDSEGGAPVGIIEASAVGLPVISTYHADIPEVVIDGISGLLSKERDFESLAVNLKNLITQPEIRKEYGLNGREHVCKNYNLRDQIKKLEKIYLTTING